MISDDPDAAHLAFISGQIRELGQLMVRLDSDAREFEARRLWQTVGELRERRRVVQQRRSALLVQRFELRYG